MDEKWTPHLSNWYNTDASKLPQNNSSYIGLVSRDSKGRILFFSGNELGDVTILMVEAIVVRLALRIAAVKSTDNSVIETDSSIVINSSEGHTDIPNLVINFIEDIKNLAKNFNQVQFSYCIRTQNSVVGGITKRVHSSCTAFIY